MPIDKLRFTPGTRNVTVEGTAKPGDTVKVENLSAAPFAGQWREDAYGRGVADPQGKFRVEVPAGAAGDHVRLTLASAGAADEVFSLRLPGVDTRRAEIAQQALRLREERPGVYRFDRVSANPTVGEPSSSLTFVNTRTNEKVSFVLDANGRLPASARLVGAPGDTWGLGASDGTHNLDGSKIYSYLVAAEPPQLVNGRQVRSALPAPGASTRLERFTGPLFVDGPSATDPQQGNIGDCYLVASLSALAATHPEQLQRMIADNGDGTYTVTFKRYDELSRRYVEEPVTVTPELYASWGGPTYGSSSNSSEPAKMELWFPVMEKAYAAWKGSYAAAKWGFPFEIFEACLGRQGRHFDVQDTEPGALFDELQRAGRNKEPMVMWTVLDSAERPLTNTGLVADHAYTVLGVEESNGERFAVLRNPWGRGEPAGNGPDDGVFKMPWASFLTYSAGVGVGRE